MWLNVESEEPSIHPGECVCERNRNKRGETFFHWDAKVIRSDTSTNTPDKIGKILNQNSETVFKPLVKLKVHSWELFSFL